MTDGESLRLLSIEARNPWADRIFDRRVSARDARTPVQMPEGRVVVGRFDRKTNDAIALAKPVEIRAGKTALVWPEAPADSDVLLILTKPPELQLAKPIPARLAIDDGTSKRAPDVLLNGFDRIIAIWYGVAARRATISFQSESAHWPSTDVTLNRGKVTTLRSRVEPLPKVSVFINAPPEATLPEDFSLDLRRVSDVEPFRTLAVRAGVHELIGAPAALLRLTLNLGPWRMIRDVDLSSGEDATVTFDIEPISVSGTVYFGDARAEAEIAFLNDGDDWLAVRTNERGDYETTFWWPRVHVARITIAGTKLPPYTEAFIEIFESGKVDFHVPRTDYLVRVRDASTGRGVAGARVTAGNVWTDTTSRGRQAAQRVITDDEGIAILPPLQNGELIVSVHSERHVPQEPLRVQVDDRHHELDIVLQPLRTATSLRLLLPNGAPATLAEAWAFDHAMQPIWRGAADANGTLDIPDVAMRSRLLLRHPRAASTLRSLPADEYDITWMLESPAEPLTVFADGHGLIALWLDGVKLSGPPLAFASWSVAAADANGLWIGRNLPPKSTQLLILPPAAYASNAYDSVAQRVEYPWPARVTAPKF
jgi:hypothetical protein